MTETAFKESFTAFMEREGIQNLSTGPLECDDCGVSLKCSACPQCGKDGGQIVCEPFFSWCDCECCGTTLGGDREDAHGYNPTTNQVQKYVVCSDCVYFAEYGELPDGWTGD